MRCPRRCKQKILSGGEFTEATAEHSVALVKTVLDTYGHIRILRESITDHGSQFYANKRDEEGKAAHLFELFLAEHNVRHILCRYNHPQSNGKIEKWFDLYQKLKEQVKDENTQSKKEHKKRLFVYSFNLMDLRTRMYVGFGTSFRSEKGAYNAAMAMAAATGVKINSVRLDRYYSGQSTVEHLVEMFGSMTLFMIPKTNTTVQGPWPWKRMLASFVTNIQTYLEEYYRRNQSESGISEDKKRTGWRLGQKRPDRIDTAHMLTSLGHNLY